MRRRRGGLGWAGSGWVALPSGSGAGERQVVSSEHGCGRQGAGVRRERGPGVPVRAVLQVQELGARRAGAGRNGTGCGEVAAGQRLGSGELCAPGSALTALLPRSGSPASTWPRTRRPAPAWW